MFEESLGSSSIAVQSQYYTDGDEENGFLNIRNAMKWERLVRESVIDRETADPMEGRWS